jgi:hypothetical protein
MKLDGSPNQDVAEAADVTAEVAGARAGRRSMAQPLPDRAQVVELHPSFCIATWDCMTIVVLNGAIRGARLAPVFEEARRQCQRYPEGGGFTLLIGPHAGLPDADARRMSSEALAECGAFIHCAAVVLDWDGFRAATARSIVSTLFLATRRRLMSRVFHELTEAAQWQAAMVRRDPPIGAATYLHVLTELRTQQYAHRRALRR